MVADLKSIVSDRNWYQIQLQQFPKLSMTGLALGDGKDSSAVFFQTTNTSSPAQKWQISASRNDSYILRSQASAGNAYLSVRENSTTQEEIGGLTAIIRDAKAVGPEALWTIEPFGNGFFHLQNLANGTDWRLFAQAAGLMAMTQNITGEQPNQSFNLTRIGEIKDSKFESAPVEPGPTASPPTGTPPVADPSQTGNPGNPGGGGGGGGGSSGLSTGATIGVAVGVSGAAIIAIAFGLFLLFRRRRRRNDIRSSIVAETVEAPYVHAQDPPKYRYDQPSPQPYSAHDAEPQELDTSHVVSEMPAATAPQQSSPVELPSNARDAR